MDERKVKRIYHPPAVPAADLFKGGKQRRVAAYACVSTPSDEQLNSVDILNTIRQLKAANVEVFFEKENIYTMDSKGEFLITPLSSMRSGTSFRFCTITIPNCRKTACPLSAATANILSQQMMCHPGSPPGIPPRRNDHCGIS